MSSITEAVELALLLLRIVGDSWPIAFMVVALYLIGTLRRMHNQAMERQTAPKAANDTRFNVVRVKALEDKENEIDRGFYVDTKTGAWRKGERATGAEGASRRDVTEGDQ